jgi:hypothetical protein
MTAARARSELREVLGAYARALGREAHVLAGQPELIFQQLHNRLQWQAGAAEGRLALERERRSVPGARPWLRTRTRWPESEALVRTLAGHADRVGACAYSPDGRWIVSASDDKTLMVWNAETGARQLTLTGHDLYVRDCAVRSSPLRWCTRSDPS